MHAQGTFLASDLPFFRDFKEKFGCGKLFKADDRDSLKEELMIFLKNSSAYF